MGELVIQVRFRNVDEAGARNIRKSIEALVKDPKDLEVLGANYQAGI